MTKNNNIHPEIQMLLYIHLTDSDARFCTEDKKLLAAADQLIVKGLIKEVEGPGGNDRAFVLTDSGIEKISSLIL